MNPASSTPGWSRGNVFVACLIFAAALGFHAWGATRGWYQVNLGGSIYSEFRQTQTAVSTLFIQRDHNFSLAYPTPVLGRPWTIPLEFPLYQWAVVGWSNATGTPLIQSARTVTLICFYLGLPALYGLLAGLGLNPSQRLLVLAFVVGCPLYIFYAQAFLIETMAWMFGLWFLLGFFRAIEYRTGAWWLLAAVAGTGTGLVKVTTFAFFLMPAFVSLAVVVWRERPTQPGCSWRPWRQIALQVAASLLLPVLATVWWTRYADAIKRASVGGAFLTSAVQRNYIFGVGQRFSREYWPAHFAILFREIASWPVLAVTLAALVWTRAWWRVALALIGCFFAVQVVFPILYSWHDYYYVANAAALMVVVGLAANGLLGSRMPRTVAWTVVAVLLGLQAWTFRRFHYPILTDAHPRENSIPQILNLVTQPDDVVVVAGDDWASLIPFYSQRRAIMIRHDIEANLDAVNQLLAAQAGEPVTALLVQAPHLHNQALIGMVQGHFHLDPRPVVQTEGQRIYLSPERRLEAMANYDRFPWLTGIALAPESALDPARYSNREILWNDLPFKPRTYLEGISPRPWKIFGTYGIAAFDFEGRSRLLACTDTKLWFRVGAGSHDVVAECAIVPGAYADKIPRGDRTDGVEFVISEVQPDGTARTLASLFLDPTHVPADRGVHQLSYHGEIAPGADLRIETRPGPRNNYTCDWALLGPVTIR